MNAYHRNSKSSIRVVLVRMNAYKKYMSSNVLCHIESFSVFKFCQIFQFCNLRSKRISPTGVYIGSIMVYNFNGDITFQKANL
jgi:hypothetical protein